MRFQVPQFIEVEDKLFGPLTFKQFVYLAGAGGVAVVAVVFLPNLLAFLIAGPVIVFGIALAFWKVNNRPFIHTVESFFKYATKEKLYIWKKEEKKVVKKPGETSASPQVYLPKLSNNTLKDLSWNLDVTQSKSVEDKEKELP